MNYKHIFSTSSADALKNESEGTGEPIADIVRRAVEGYFGLPHEPIVRNVTNTGVRKQKRGEREEALRLFLSQNAGLFTAHALSQASGISRPACVTLLLNAEVRGQVKKVSRGYWQALGGVDVTDPGV